MPISSPLESIDSQQFGYAQATHLLNRAGFGGRPEEILSLQLMGLDKAVDYLVDYQSIDPSQLENPQFDPDIISPPLPQEQAKRAQSLREGNTSVLQETELEQQRRRANDIFQMRDIERWWLERMIATPRPLEERLTLMWHTHFPTSYRVVSDSYLMFLQNELFRTNASGSFADLLLGVIRDPAMLLFLNNNSNGRAGPNEQMARALLERFAFGQGHFDEHDVREAARCLTGYSVYDNSFLYAKHLHDEGPKAVLGERGNLDGDDLAAVLLRKSACQGWIAQRLYGYFVADLDGMVSDETQAVIHQMAGLLADHRYKLGPVLKQLFKSQHFYDPAIMGGKIKDPAQLLIGTARLLGTPQRNPETLVILMDQMGQRLLDPPSYVGWPTGQQWINSATLQARQNLCVYLITGKSPLDRQWSGADVNYDPQPILDQLTVKSPDAIVDYLTGMLLAAPLAQKRRRHLIDFVENRKRVTSNTLIALFLLITALPEYQLC